ncbi:PspC domain-containing protein [Sphingomonas parva]|uniref:PspC domain-containing protein n=1 Tax=Sphingomonas parva TaxID=2555898 RepID=A0A4Y8ZWY6_9SPHN|nr:PspC domain-containing protein [Sphingomonas parva]TFI59705.1 PspC domain-containing protein [Sphingomonas parva]
MTRTFRLDRRNGKLLGVCAGLARMTGWDATLIRVGLVLITLFGAFPWTLIAYGAAAVFAKKGAASLADDAGRPRSALSARDLRESMRDIDRRMIEVDSYVASPNRTLAQEIDSLR